MATPEENMAAALERAEKARSEGKLDRAATWDASADRYRRIIEAKQKIETAASNIEKIKQDLKKTQESSKEIKSGPNKGWYQHVTSRPSSTCPSGHERVRITFMDGVETNVESLGCYGNNKIVKEEPPIQLGSSLINEGTPTLSPTPPTPPRGTPITPPPPPTRTAPIDTVLFEDDSMSQEIMADLIFEDIGGHELLSLSRNDIINGQTVSYSPIKNLGLIQQNYNPNNLFSLQKTSDKYFANFAIKFDEKVPEEGNGEDGVNVYIEEETGDLIIETINMNNDEQVESEIAINGTIYEANFGETVS